MIASMSVVQVNKVYAVTVPVICFPEHDVILIYWRCLAMHIIIDGKGSPVSKELHGLASLLNVV